MNLKKRIKEKGFTLEMLATKMNVSQPSLSQIINGNPTYGKLKEIADILGISVAEIVRDDDVALSKFICPNCGKTFKLVEENGNSN